MYLDYNIVDIASERLSYVLPNVNGRRVVIWSANIRGRDAFLALRRLGVQPSFFVDKNYKMIPEHCGLSVKDPSVLKKEEDFVVVATNMFFPEIRGFLEDRGFSDPGDYYYINAQLQYMSEDIIYRGCRIGRYSYGYSDFFSEVEEADIRGASIGRFCSISSSARFVINHPDGNVSTHPFSYYKAFVPEKYREMYLRGMEETSSLTKEGNKTPYGKGRGFALSIGNDVWVGAGAIILEGVLIGDGAVIGAGAVVTHDVEPYSVVAGVPAERKKYRFSKEIIEKLLSIKWWEWEPEEIFKNAGLMRFPEAFTKKILS